MGTESEQQYDFDLVTIGAGSGGTRASRFAAQTYGAKVAIIELPFAFISDDHHGGAGGTCVIRGCVPKKLMVYASAFADEFRDSHGFGWDSSAPGFNIKILMEKKAQEIARLNGVYNKLLKGAGVEFIEGSGSVMDPHTVEVQSEGGKTWRITAKHILIAAGGRAVKAPIEGAEHAITSDEILVMDELPGRAVVVGAGYIALEFAGILHGMGVETHVMYRADSPLRGFDDECREQVSSNMKGRGMHVYAETSPTRIEKVGEKKFIVHFKTSDGAEQSVECGMVLFGTGRKPNTDRLNLGTVGLELDKTGAIKVDEFSHTNVDSIWAIGDITDRMNLTPVALMEGMAFAATVFGGKPTSCGYENIASAVFVQPPLATCGMTENQAIEAVAGEIDVFVSKFKPMKNTLSGRDEKMLIKMIVEVESDLVLGVHIVGPDAAEMMQGVAIAMKCNARKAQFDATVGIHPTAAEELVTMRTRTRRVQGKGGAAKA